MIEIGREKEFVMAQ